MCGFGGCFLCFLLFLLLLGRSVDVFAVYFDSQRLFLCGEPDLVESGGLIFCSQSAEEVQAVARAFEDELVLFEMDAFDLDEAQREGGLRRGAVEFSIGAEVQIVFKIAAAEVEGFALQLLADLLFAEGVLVTGWDGCGLCGWLGGSLSDRLRR